MVTQQQLHSRWDEVKGRLKERWQRLNDQELEQARHDVEHLMLTIEQQTGAARDQIERTLDEVFEDSETTLHRASHAAREYADRATAAVRGHYDHLTGSVREGYVEAENLVRRRPAESVAVAFGAGLITVVVVGLLVRPR